MTALSDLIDQLNGNRYSQNPQEVICQVDTLVAVLTQFGTALSLANNHVFVGNASNLPTDVAMSGDVSIVASGATTIQSIKGKAVVAAGSTLAVQTQQIFSAAGAFTYNTPANCRLIKIRLVGGGGGGGGSGTGDGGNGGAGGATNFDVFIGNGGGGATGTAMIGGTAGSGGTGSGLSLVGSTGSVGASNGIASSSRQGVGGTSMLGGGSGIVAVAAPGRGGGGAGGGIAAVASGAAGGGGGAGEYREILISAPAASYNGTVGAAGAGGTAGTSGQAGTAGNLGLVIVDEFY